MPRGGGRGRRGRGGRGGRGTRGRGGRNSAPQHDVYEYDSDTGGKRRRGADGDFDEEAKQSFEYELPKNFDADEEISSDDAFDSSDEARYGDLFASHKQGAESDSSDDEEEVAPKATRTSARGRRGPQARGAGVGAGGGTGGSSSDDAEESSDEGEEAGFSVLDQLDANLAKRAAAKGAAAVKKPDDDAESQSASDSESGSESGSSDGSHSDAEGDGADSDGSSDGSVPESSGDEESDDEAHAQLLQAIQQLEEYAGGTAAGAASKPGGNATEGKKRVRVVERDEGVEESEYNLAAGDGSGSASNGNEVTLDALMGSLRDTTEFGALKKKIARLTSGSAPLQPPTSAAVEAVATRKVSYKSAARAAGKWQPVVQANRRAEVLKLTEEERAPGLTHASLADKFTATTEMEKAVAKLLADGGVSGSKGEGERELEAAGLAARELSVKEIRARKAQLAKLKALLLYDEQKRRRANKIKSKAFRRVRKRQLAKEQAREMEAIKKADPDMARRLEESQAEKRAHERMTQKHRNKSKWARRALRQGGTANEAFREALNDQNQVSVELRRKVERKERGEYSSTDSSSDDSDGGSSDGSGNSAARRERRKRRKLAAEARGLLHETEQDGTDASNAKRPGLFKMKFMQRALEKQRESAREEVGALVRDLETGKAYDGGAGDWADVAIDDEEDGEDSRAAKESAEAAQRRKEAQAKATATDPGRRSFAGAEGRSRRAAGADGRSAAEQREADQAVAKRLARGDGTTSIQAASSRTAVAGFIDVGGAETSDDSEPKESAKEGATASKGTSWVPAASSSAAAEAAGVSEDNPWLAVGANDASRDTTKRRKGVRKRADASSGGADGQAVLDVAGVLEKLPAAEPQKATKRARAGSSDSGRRTTRSAAKAATADSSAAGNGGGAASSDGGAASGNGASNSATGNSAGTQARSKQDVQAELVRRAFATDATGVEEEFEAEKAEIEDRDKPKEEKKLAGWGSWAGIGAPSAEEQQKPAKRRRKANIHAAAPPKPKQPAAPDVPARKDAHLKRVIINEKRDKRGAKYLAPTVPYPFTSREQYEQSLRVPLGKDWNAPSATANMTTPEVITRAGAIIQPIAFTKTVAKVGKKQPAAGGAGKRARGGKAKGGKGSR